MHTISESAYQGDIVTRLRNWRGLHLAHGGQLFEEAADEIARLRLAISRLAEQDATLSVSGGNVTVTMDATLTDAEREALTVMMGDSRRWGETTSQIVRGLLERLGGGR